MRPAQRLAACIIAVAIAGCRTAAPPPVETGMTQVTGSWGGDHVSLVLTAETGELEFDCASAVIAGGLSVDGSGTFSADGRYSSRGGPEQAGRPRPSAPARFSGSISGDRMTLLVRVEQSEIGSFALRRGAEPVLFRCL